MDSLFLKCVVFCECSLWLDGFVVLVGWGWSWLSLCLIFFLIFFWCFVGGVFWGCDCDFGVVVLLNCCCCGGCRCWCCCWCGCGGICGGFIIVLIFMILFEGCGCGVLEVILIVFWELIMGCGFVRIFIVICVFLGLRVLRFWLVILSFCFVWLEWLLLCWKIVGCECVRGLLRWLLLMVLVVCEWWWWWWWGLERNWWMGGLLGCCLEWVREVIGECGMSWYCCCCLWCLFFDVVCDVLFFLGWFCFEGGCGEFCLCVGRDEGSG